MSDAVIFLLKANIALLLFYLGYSVLLRRLTFYNLNRFYLLFGVGFSACYPLVDVANWAIEKEVISYEVMDILPVWEPAQTPEFSVWPYVMVLFWLVVAFFFVRLFVRMLSLWMIHRGSVASQWQIFRYRQVFRPVNPFSFWRNIYLNVHQHEESTLSEIFHHERVHVQEYHTVDILIAELCSLLCWFNPAAWMYRHAIRENLEFVTDRKVLQSGADRKAYQYSLLRTGTFSGQPSLVTNFNLRSIKRRIMMMNKKRSSRLQISKYVLVMPAIAVAVLIFTVTNAYQEEQVAEVGVLEKQPETNRPLVIGDMEGVSTKPLDTTENTNVIMLPGLDSTKKAPLYILDGVRMDKDKKGFSMDRLDPNRIESIAIIKDGAEALYGESGKNGVILITTKKEADSVKQKLPKGRISGLSFKVDSTAPGSIEEVVGYRTTGSGESGNTGKGVEQQTLGNDRFNGALIVIDGEEASGKDLNRLNPDDIHSITVLKGQDAIDKYGKKGEKGVVEVTSKAKLRQE